MAEIVIQPVEEPSADIWKLIYGVARNELRFPDRALAYFRETLVGEELERRVREPNVPFFLARIGSELVGVAVGAKPEGGVGTIVWLIVSPDHRGEGIGTRLFAEIAETYRSLGCHKMKLTASTVQARTFYERMGMNVEGHLKKHWWGMDFWSLGMCFDARH